MSRFKLDEALFGGPDRIAARRREGGGHNTLNVARHLSLLIDRVFEVHPEAVDGQVLRLPRPNVVRDLGLDAFLHRAYDFRASRQTFTDDGPLHGMMRLDDSLAVVGGSAAASLRITREARPVLQPDLINPLSATTDALPYEGILAVRAILSSVDPSIRQALEQVGLLDLPRP